MLTRLLVTLDTIALCSMDYRFNSFYTEDMHPFVDSMNNVLTFRNQRTQLGGKLKGLIMPSYEAQYRRDNEYMFRISRELVQFRRDNPTDKKDLLNSMVYGKDPKTGDTMRDDLIAANMVTFLIAGHETTSGLLSFAFSEMLLNPSTYFAAQQEVDRVVGKDKIEAKHLNQLPYLTAVLRETLRLHPTAPGFARVVRPENKDEKVTICDGKYEIERGVPNIILLGKVHRDPKVYGDDAEEFKPERMMDDKFEKLPKNAWKVSVSDTFDVKHPGLTQGPAFRHRNESLHWPSFRLAGGPASRRPPSAELQHVTRRPAVPHRAGAKSDNQAQGLLDQGQPASWSDGH